MPLVPAELEGAARNLNEVQLAICEQAYLRLGVGPNVPTFEEFANSFGNWSHNLDIVVLFHDDGGISVLHASNVNITLEWTTSPGNLPALVQEAARTTRCEGILNNWSRDDRALWQAAWEALGGESHFNFAEVEEEEAVDSVNYNLDEYANANGIVRPQGGREDLVLESLLDPDHVGSDDQMIQAVTQRGFDWPGNVWPARE